MLDDEKDDGILASDSAPIADTGPEPSDMRADLEKALATQQEKVEGIVDETTDKSRDEKGRFSEKSKTTGTNETVKATETQEAATPVPTGPPRGWSAASKADFEKLPAHLKNDIIQREVAANDGFKKYSGLDVWVQEANQMGVPLPQMLTNYRNAEQLLQKDFLSGTEQLCNYYKINPVALAQAIFQKAGMGQPQGQQRQQQQAQPSQEMQNYIRGLEERVNRIDQRYVTENQTKLNSEIERFFNDPAHQYAENVMEEMLELIEGRKATGKAVSTSDLKQIYQTALKINPETAKLFENGANPVAKSQEQQRVTNQARQAAKATVGAPSGGSPPVNKSTAPTDIRDVFEQMRQARA